MRRIAFIIGLFIWQSCSSPYEDQGLIISDSYSVHSVFQEQSNITFRIGRLKSPLDTFYTPLSDSLQVYFYSGKNQYIASKVIHTNDPINTYFLEKFDNSLNRDYELKVYSGTKEIIQSRIVVPNRKLIDLEFGKIVTKNLKENAVQSATIQLNLMDDLEESNYYHLIPRKVKWVINDNGSPRLDGELENLEIKVLNSSLADVVVLEHEPGLLFSDRQNLKGDPMIFDVFIRTKNKVLSDLEVFKEISFELRNVNREYFLYHKSVSSQIQNRKLGIPALEPIIIYSNIRGGSGIFAAFNSTNLGVNLQ